MTEATTLTGQLIVLFLLTEKDYPVLKNVLNDQETMASLIPYFQRSEWTDEQVHERYESFHRSYEHGTGIHWAISSLEHKKLVVGNCGFKKIDPSNKEGEFGIILSKLCWGRGHALECHLLALNYGFSKLGLKRIYFNTDEHNLRMRNFFSKCKISYHQQTEEGYLQYEILKKDRKNISLHIKDLLRIKIRPPVE